MSFFSATTAEYKRKADFGMIVWAGNHDLTVAFADSPADNLLTGIDVIPLLSRYLFMLVNRISLSRCNYFPIPTAFLPRRPGDEAGAEVAQVL